MNPEMHFFAWKCIISLIVEVSPLVDEERMRSGHWLVLVLCVPFSALALMVGGRRNNLAHKNHIPLIPRGSLAEWVEEEDHSWNQ